MHDQGRWGFAVARSGEADGHHRSIRQLFYGLSGSGTGGTRGGGAGGAADLRTGFGLRGFERSRGVAARSAVSGVGREGGSEGGRAAAGQRSGHRLGGQKHPQPYGTGGAAKLGEKERYKKIILDEAAVDRTLVDIFLQAHGEPRQEIVLDLDSTDIPLHGEQEERFFHGYYGHYCYLPLY